MLCEVRSPLLRHLPRCRPYNRIQQWDWCKVAQGMDVSGNLRAFKASKGQPGCSVAASQSAGGACPLERAGGEFPLGKATLALLLVAPRNCITFHVTASRLQALFRSLPQATTEEEVAAALQEAVQLKDKTVLIE